MSITEIAVASTLVFMFVVAAAGIASSRGYGFDLRRSADRRRDPKRNGGRRADDQVVA